MTHKTKNILMAIGGAILLAALLVAALALASCSILNLGGTNEDGTPKTSDQARAFIRSIADAATQTWVTDILKRQPPQVFAMFDKDQNGVLTLAEIEAGINTDDPQSMTMLLVMAIDLYRSKPRR